MMRYSATTNGFYAEDIDYASVPDDCVKISEDDYLSLIDGQASKKEIIPDPDKPGYPKLVPVE